MAGVEINNEVTGSFDCKASYSGGFYIVEAEGIYTGYNYYESRYYDSIVNPSSNASSAKGSTQDDSAWSYDKEVSYIFGYRLSYLPYEQKLTGVTVEDRVCGNVTATIEITNNGDKRGLFLAQFSANGAAGKILSAITDLLRIAAAVLFIASLMGFVSTRVEDLGYIFGSNENVLGEIRTEENIRSAYTVIAGLVFYVVTWLVALAACFCGMTKAAKKGERITK